jgi:hypothetical protein
MPGSCDGCDVQPGFLALLSLWPVRPWSALPQFIERGDRVNKYVEAEVRVEARSEQVGMTIGLIGQFMLRRPLHIPPARLSLAASPRGAAGAEPPHAAPPACH